MRYSDTILSSSYRKVFYRYLFPSILATVLIAGTYLVDTICIGQTLGERGLAALNVVVPVTGLMYAAGFMFAFGSSNLFSNSLGEGNVRKAREYYGTSVLGLAVFTLLIMIPGLLFTGPISRLLSGGADFSSETEIYLKYVFLFTPFYCLETFYNVYARNDGAPVFSMLGTFVTCGFNVVFDYLFIFVLGWGMRGASLATGIALVLGFIAVFSSTGRFESQLKIQKARVRLTLMGEILINGLPDFLREFSGSAVVLIVNLILLNVSGSTAVAAYGVIANLGNVVLCGLAGVSNTVQPLSSYAYGAGHYKRSDRFLSMGILVTIVIAGAYILFA